MSLDSVELSVLRLGRATDSALDHLQSLVRVSPQQVALDGETRLDEERTVLNRAVDAAGSDWILILREGETVSAAAAAEIAAAIRSTRAWGYRLPVESRYAGRALGLFDDRVGEIRLFHRRHARFIDEKSAREMKVQGSVIRLAATLQSQRYATVDEHRSALSSTRAKRGALQRMVRFAASVLRHPLAPQAWSYFWIEAGYV